MPWTDASGRGGGGYAPPGKEDERSPSPTTGMGLEGLLYAERNKPDRK